MASIRAIVKSELLTWARESMHLPAQVAAKKIGVTSEKLREWEAGVSVPTIAQLRKAAEVYKRPLAVFFLSKPPKIFDALHDYRRLPDIGSRAASPELSLAIRTARSQREVLLEIADDLKIELPETPSSFKASTASPEAFAESARNLLKISLASQFSWERSSEALSNWIRALESVGVLVFQTSEVELTEMRGFALHSRPLPVIVANAKDSPQGRVFTLLHEFAHILLMQSPLCDLHEDRDLSSENTKIEVFCNRVAGDILVPQEALQRAIDSLRMGRKGPSDSDLEALAKRFKVSREVIVRRLLTIGTVSLDFYRSKRDSYLRMYQQRARREGGFAPYEVVRVRDLGKLFVRTVVSAYRQEAITSADLSNYLGIKIKYLPKVEKLVFKGGE